MAHKIKFYVKIQNDVAESFWKLTQADGDQVLTQAQVC